MMLDWMLWVLLEILLLALIVAIVVGASFLFDDEYGDDLD